MNTKKFYEVGKVTYRIHVDSQGFEYIKERGSIAKEFPYAYRCSSCSRFNCYSPQSKCTSCKYGRTQEALVQRSQEEILKAREERKQAAALKREEKLRRDSKGMAMILMRKIVISGYVPASKEEAVGRILKEIDECIKDLYFSNGVKVNGKMRSALELTKALDYIRIDPKKVDALASILMKDHE